LNEQIKALEQQQKLDDNYKQEQMEDDLTILNENKSELSWEGNKSDTDDWRTVSIADVN
jgi:hypothetical protein